MKLPSIRRIAVAAGVVGVAVAVTAAWLLTTVDAGRWQAVAGDWLATRYQRTLTVGGPVELALLPRPALKAKGVRLSERGRTDPFVTADEVALSIELLPLLRRQVVVDRLSARGVLLVYARAAGGAHNVDDLLAPPEAAAESKAPELRIRALQLDDVRVQLRDEMLGVDGAIVAASLSAPNLAQAESPVTWRARVQLQRPRLADLPIEGSARLARDGSAWQAADVRVASPGGTIGEVALGPSTLALARASFGPGATHFALQGVDAAVAGRRGAEAFELALGWPQVAVEGGKLRASAVEGTLVLRGAVAAITTQFRVPEPGGDLQMLRLPGLDVKLAGQVGARQLAGEASAEATLAIARGAATFERIDARATLALAGQPPLPVGLHGRAELEAWTVRWSLDGTLDASRLTSTGQLSLAADVPEVQAQVRIDRLDLNRLLGTRPASPASAAGSESPLPFDALAAVDGHFGIAAGTLFVRQVRLGDLQLDAQLHSGALRITRLRTRAWGGMVDASASADARSRRVALKLAANDVDLQALLNDLAGRSPLEGKARIVADVAASGPTLTALRKSLAGASSLRVRDGAIVGADLLRALQQSAGARTARQDAAVLRSAADRTEFVELSASARLANGVAYSDDLDMRAPYLRIGGSGRFDIAQGLVDYTARASVTAPTVTSIGARGLAGLRGVTVPVRVSGPIDAVVWTIEWSGVVASTIESQLKELLSRRSAASAPGGTPPSPLQQLLEKLGRVPK